MNRLESSHGRLRVVSKQYDPSIFVLLPATTTMAVMRCDKLPILTWDTDQQTFIGCCGLSCPRYILTTERQQILTLVLTLIDRFRYIFLERHPDTDESTEPSKTHGAIIHSGTFPSSDVDAPSSPPQEDSRCAR